MIKNIIPFVPILYMVICHYPHGRMKLQLFMGLFFWTSHASALVASFLLIFQTVGDQQRNNQ